MFQIRLHGRGGQGVVTAAEMLSLARTFRPGLPEFRFRAHGRAGDRFCPVQ